MIYVLGLCFCESFCKNIKSNNVSNQQRKWVYLISLAFIWGSSFILMKRGLVGLTAYQMGALRITFTAIFLFIYDFKSIFLIPKSKYKWIVVTAILSTFMPVFLFAIAQTKIDSSVVAVLNSLMPVFALVISAIFFSVVIKIRQVVGVIIGLVGTLILILSKGSIGESQNSLYGILVIIASIGYASNINILKYYMKDVSAVSITVGNFLVLIFPAILILYFTSFFNLETLKNPEVQKSVGYIAILSLFGTAFAKVLFNKLIKISSSVFSASVTYLIPVVAIMWGILDGESFNTVQIFGAFAILVGVYLVNKKRSSAKLDDEYAG